MVESRDIERLRERERGGGEKKERREKQVNYEPAHPNQTEVMPLGLADCKLTMEKKTSYLLHYSFAPDKPPKFSLIKLKSVRKTL